MPISISTTESPPAVVVNDLVDESSSEIQVGADVRVWCTKQWVSVEVQPSQVVVSGTNIFAAIRIRWNGGTNAPDILWIERDEWDLITVFAQHYPPDAGHWEVVWELYTPGVPTSVQLVDISSTTLSSASYESHNAQVSPTERTDFRFVTKDSLGNQINPSSGDEATLLIYHP